MGSPKEKTSSIRWWHIILIAVGCIILWIGGIWGAHCFAGTFEKAGLFGDSAGAINALFSALAFCGVVIAISLQKKELELQREELKATNEQLKAQKVEFHTQNETLKRQRFENTFFQMMSLQQEIVNGLSFSYDEMQTTKTQDGDGKSQRDFFAKAKVENSTKTSTTTITRTLNGRDIFSRLFEEAGQTYLIEKDIYCYEIRDAIATHGVEIYSYLVYPTILDHYFRHFYQILKFIDTSNLVGETDKCQYASMLRATLSRYELVWLFYNGLSEKGKTKLKAMIEKYALLKDLRKELLVEQEHEYLYSSGAYEYVAVS